MNPPFQIETLSLQTLERLVVIAKRLFYEAREPALKMLHAAAVRGLREEIRRREVEHRDLRPSLKDDYDSSFNYRTTQLPPN